jgi:hypothetical protein
MSSISVLKFCDPALFFLVIAFFDVLYIIFVSSKNKNKDFNKKIKGFILLFLCIIGWSFIINSVCNYDKYIALAFSIIPLLYLSSR